MKRLLLFSLTVLMAALAARADVAINATNFPDANFRSYLMSEYPSGTITTAQLNARTELNLSGKGISNAKGIEYFTQLTRLDLYNNNLTTIDVSANTKLTYLNVGINKLTSITLGTIPTLEQLYLQNNQLTSVWACNYPNLRTLWVNNNPNLTSLKCYRNGLTNFDIRNCTSLSELMCYENPNLSTISGLETCTALTYVDCEDCKITDLSALSGMNSLQTLLARNNKLTTLDVSNKYSLNRLRVSGNYLMTKLNCSGCNLNSLDVTNCTAMTELWCYNNNHLGDNGNKIAGLSSCSALEIISCYSCGLTDLQDLIYLRYLTRVICSDNDLTSLSINNMSDLWQLSVDDNEQLTSLTCTGCDQLQYVNVTGCVALEVLDCHNDPQLSEITDLSNCTALTYIDCSNCAFSDLSAVKSLNNLATLIANNNPITTLDVGFMSSLNYLAVSGSSQLTELKCHYCNLSMLDVRGCTALSVLKCYNNYNLTGIVGLADCTAMTYLDCEDCAIADVIGVKDMPDLQTLWCRNNQLTSIYLEDNHQLRNLRASGNTNLQELISMRCNLVNFDITGCTSLVNLNCGGNENLANITGLATCTALKTFSGEYCAFTSLDMTFCPGLKNLYCYHNNLNALDVTGLTELELLNCMINYELPAITGVEGCTALNILDCGKCAISSLDLSNLAGLQELYCNDNQLTVLYADNKPALTILDVSTNPKLEEVDCHNCALVTLEVYNCPVLEYIDCRNNQLEELHTASNTNLMYLLCNSNQLTELGLDNNSKLLYLWCNQNQLTSLDMSHFPDDFRSLDCRHNQIAGTIDVGRFSNLYELAISSNQFTSLDNVADHTELRTLYCSDNLLTSLDASGCTALQALQCHYNQLTSLDASNCSALSLLYCAYNLLPSMNISGCSSLRNLLLIANMVKAPQMGQIVDNLPTWTEENPGGLYVITYSDEVYTEGNVITASQVNQAHDKFWNVYAWLDDDIGWEPYAGSSFQRGDVNGDSNVNISDVTALINYLLSHNSTGVNVDAADCNGDNNVNISDVTTLINYLLSHNWPAGARAASVQDQPQAAAPFTMRIPEPDTLQLVRPAMRASSPIRD